MSPTMAANPALPESSVYSGKTIEQAVAAGLSRQGLEPGQAEVTVLARGGRGFLGFGARPARVRVVPKSAHAQSVEDLARGVLARMGIEARVTARQDGREFTVRVEAGEDDGLLIGRRGETLQALQHVLLRMASRQMGGGIEAVRVDVGGYRDQREAQLRREALDLAAQVSRTGKRAATEPLSPEERRVVHRALADRPGVSAHVGSTGPGVAKRVIILPARSGER